MKKRETKQSTDNPLDGWRRALGRKNLRLTWHQVSRTDQESLVTPFLIETVSRSKITIPSPIKGTDIKSADLVDLLDTTEAAKYLRVTRATLANWRSTKSVLIPYIKIGRKVAYTKAALDKFIKKQTHDDSA